MHILHGPKHPHLIIICITFSTMKQKKTLIVQYNTILKSNGIILTNFWTMGTFLTNFLKHGGVLTNSPIRGRYDLGTFFYCNLSGEFLDYSFYPK